MWFTLYLLSSLIIQPAFAGSCPTKTDLQECEPKKSWWSRGWATTIFAGPLTSQTSSKIIQDADFGDSGIAAIAVSKELTRPISPPKRGAFKIPIQKPPKVTDSLIR